MDGAQFDDLLRSLTESRRTVLGGTLAAIGLALGISEANAKGKGKGKGKGNKKKKKNKNTLQNNDDNDGADNGAPPPPASPPPQIFVSPCPEGEDSCAGRPFDCCEVGLPICGPNTTGPNPDHVCCPIQKSHVCVPDEVRGMVVGICCLPQEKCCPLRLNGTIHCCPPGTICCPGGSGEHAGCCQPDQTCCSVDANCGQNMQCSTKGCCEPKILPCLPPNELCGTECCSPGMGCHPEHGGCDTGG
jgi:hypothetical protein